MRNIYDANHNPIHPNDKDLVLGGCFGILIEHRGKLTCNGTYDESPLIHAMIEDDGNWFVEQLSLDSYWIDDMIEVLTAAKKRINNA